MNKSYKIPGKALELSNAFGFLFPAEVYLLGALAATLPDNGIVVNIGAGVGTSALAIVEIRPKARVFTIDISEGGPLGGMLNEANAFKAANLSCPQQILGNSQVIHKDWPEIGHGESIDLLVIDGDHSAEGLQADMNGWLKYVKPGGYAVFHDYNSVAWGEVKDIVNSNMRTPAWQEVLQVDTLIAFRKLSIDTKTSNSGSVKTIQVKGRRRK